MVFKRRDKLSPLMWLSNVLWPKGGWHRAALYLRHRLHRLPDTPQKIARGVAAGVFVSFTPFFGLHFVIAFLGAKLVRGNFIAALLGTFVGNPLTYVPIGVISLKMGHFMLGTAFDHAHERSFVGKFFDAARDFWINFKALFTGADANWDGLIVFGREVFLPYLVGGILPGLVAAIAAYYLTLPMIVAYQARRKKRLRAKLEKLRKRAAGEKVSGKRG
ncbi:DUF2062 domain-containing protein [Celeribacter sp.]|uniref:DUF2062 domain-containing protein n=1 Tax=Celeribacter sp. TaxID=1890673 RepID=UPI003A90F8D2